MAEERDIQLEKYDTAVLDSTKLLSKADVIFRNGKYDKALSMYMDTAKKAKVENHISNRIQAFSQVSRCFSLLGNLKKGKTWLNKARIIATSNYPKGWARYLGVKGRFGIEENEIENAVTTFNNMYDFSTHHKLYNYAIDAAHMLALLGTKEHQIKWALKGIKEANIYHEYKWLGALWNNLGWAYHDIGEHEKSLEALKKAREYHRKYSNEKAILIADWSVGCLLRKLGRVEEAEKLFKPVLEKSKHLGDVEWIGLTIQELGEIEIIRGNFILGLSYLKQSQKYLEEAKMPEWDLTGYQNLVKKIEKINKEFVGPK